MLVRRGVASASRSAQHQHQLRAALSPLSPSQFDTSLADDSIALAGSSVEALVLRVVASVTLIGDASPFKKATFPFSDIPRPPSS